jgi:hypothetical protein
MILGGLTGVTTARSGVPGVFQRPPWRGCGAPARLTTLEVVCGATRVGSGFIGGRHGACDIVGTSLNRVWHLPRSLLIAVVVVVGRVGVNGGVGAVLWKLDMLWWTPAAGGRGSCSVGRGSSGVDGMVVVAR